LSTGPTLAGVPHASVALAGDALAKLDEAIVAARDDAAPPGAYSGLWEARGALVAVLEAAARGAHSAPRRPRCAGASGPYCKPLADRLEMVNARAKGLSEFELTTLATGESRVVGVVFKRYASDRGLLLNFCPWCGAHITPADVAVGSGEPPR